MYFLTYKLHDRYLIYCTLLLLLLLDSIIITILNDNKHRYNIPYRHIYILLRSITLNSVNIYWNVAIIKTK